MNDTKTSEDILKELQEEQMRLHPEIYSKPEEWDCQK